MFRFLDRLSPEDVEAIAAFVQMEMLEAGYATNVEFHYLHHQVGGHPYDRLSEMSRRILAAAQTSGIGLTLLPVHYQYGGCDGRPLGPGQVRFGNDLERFLRLHEEAASALSSSSADFGIGAAPHSLRAVAKEHLVEFPAQIKVGPIHMHLAEQKAEVAEVEDAWGARPVEWVCDNLELNERWCMIHCTQMLAHETNRLARSGVVAGLCPITESSLGDGIFDGVNWLGHNGAIAIGSDSNIRISLAEEIRTLDHTQRLRDHSRAALATPTKSTARRILDEMLEGGAKASGRKTGRIEAGQFADVFALNAEHVDLLDLQGDVLLDCFVFAGGTSMVTDVWSAGRHMVKEGAHVKRPEIGAAYRRVIAGLRDAI